MTNSYARTIVCELVQNQEQVQPAWMTAEGRNIAARKQVAVCLRMCRKIGMILKGREVKA